MVHLFRSHYNIYLLALFHNSIAMELMKEAELFFLDEPTSGNTLTLYYTKPYKIIKSYVYLSKFPHIYHRS